MKYYHLKVMAEGELDDKIKIVDKESHPMLIENIGIEFDDWMIDDLGTTYPIYYTSERLKHVLDYFYEDHKCKFTEIKRVSKSLNFMDNYPEAKLSRIWQIEFEGTPLVDDFALWKNLQLVVSEDALGFLRENLVYMAESVLIDTEIDLYFEKFFEPYKIIK